MATGGPHEGEDGLRGGGGAAVAAALARPPLVLALDVGTSSVRACVYDAEAREVAGARAERASGFRTTADGGAETDADEAIACVSSVVDEALARADGAGLGRIRAVAVACFWHSLVGLDEGGRAVKPLTGWADTRAAREAEELRAAFDESATHARTGCRFHPSYWPAKLLRLRRERPDLWDAAPRWITFGELLTLRLCGETKASISMASGTGIFDQHACRWDAPLLESLGVRAGQLPALADDGESFTLDGEHTARWPALRGARFFPAIGDGAANNVGEGCVSRARVALMVGTSAAMRVVYEGEAPAALDPALWCYRLDRRRACVGGALSDGGGLFAWMRRAFGPHAGDEAFERAVAALPADAHGLTVLPFWAGERSTGWNARARGAILGLTSDTRPEDILRASLEAVAYRLALVARALEAHAPRAEEVRASGGALRESEVWPRIIADALGRPLRLSDVAEASGRGAALLALEAIGAIKSLDEVEAPAQNLITPDAARREIYRRGLERQQRLYELLTADAETARLLDAPAGRAAD